MEYLSIPTKKEIRRLMILIVLATDNDKHFLAHEQLESIVDHVAGKEIMSPINQMINRGDK